MTARHIHADAALMRRIRGEGAAAHDRRHGPAACPYRDGLRRDWWRLGYDAAAAAALVRKRFRLWIAERMASAA